MAYLILKICLNLSDLKIKTKKKKLIIILIKETFNSQDFFSIQLTLKCMEFWCWGRLDKHPASFWILSLYEEGMKIMFRKDTQSRKWKSYFKDSFIWFENVLIIDTHTILTQNSFLMPEYFKLKIFSLRSNNNNTNIDNLCKKSKRNHEGGLQTISSRKQKGWPVRHTSRY